MLTFTRILTDDEVAILSNDLLDVEGWINGAINGKLNNCLKRAAQEYRQKAKESGLKTVPITDLDCFDELKKMPGYKSRQQKEAKDN